MQGIQDPHGEGVGPAEEADEEYEEYDEYDEYADEEDGGGVLQENQHKHRSTHEENRV
jgi:hypothetical protein